MPEGYGYSPEGIRRYLEDLAKKHGILPPDVPPADNRDIFKSKDTSFVPAHEKYPREVMRQPLAELPFTIDEETGIRVPIGEVNPSQRKTMEPLPSTQRRTLGQQPRTSYISRRKTGPVDSTRGDYFLQPQPPGLQRPPVPAAPQWRPDHTNSGLNDLIRKITGSAVTESEKARLQGMAPGLQRPPVGDTGLNDLIRKITGSAISQKEANNKMQDFKSKRRTRAWRR